MLQSPRSNALGWTGLTPPQEVQWRFIGLTKLILFLMELSCYITYTILRYFYDFNNYCSVEISGDSTTNGRKKFWSSVRSLTLACAQCDRSEAEPAFTASDSLIASPIRGRISHHEQCSWWGRAEDLKEDNQKAIIASLEKFRFGEFRLCGFLRWVFAVDFRNHKKTRWKWR